MVNPAFIVVPVIASLILAAILFYFTCYNRSKSLPTAGWAHYMPPRPRRWWPLGSTKKNGGLGLGGAFGRDEYTLDDEEFQMLNRSTLTNTTSHSRQDSRHSLGSAYGPYDGQDLGTSPSDSESELEADQSPDGIAATISQVRRTLDSALSVLEMIKKTQMPRMETELEEIHRLQTLTEWHTKMLERVWQHSGPEPPPVDTRYLGIFKRLVKKCLDETRSREVMRTQDLKRYGDLKTTEEFARESIRQMARRRSRAGSVPVDQEEAEEEAEIRELGVRAMKERIALAKKLGLPVPEEKERDEGLWGLSPATSEPRSPVDDLRAPPRAYDADAAARDRLLGEDER